MNCWRTYIRYNRRQRSAKNKPQNLIIDEAVQVCYAESNMCVSNALIIHMLHMTEVLSAGLGMIYAARNSYNTKTNCYEGTSWESKTWRY